MSLLIAPLEALTDSLLSDPERRVLLALFSYRGKVTELVFPSLDALAERSLIKDKTRVSKITTSLAKKGWLTKKKKGFTGCNQYTMCMPERLTNLDSETKLAPQTKLDANTNSNLDSDTKYDVGLRDQVQVTHQVTNQYNKPITNAIAVNVQQNRFDEFWADYPKKESKADAIKAYAKAIKITSHDIITQAMLNHKVIKNWTGDQFTPMASTWLNKKRWEDEIKPNGGYSNGANQQQPTRSTSSDRMRAAANQLVSSFDQTHSAHG